LAVRRRGGLAGRGAPYMVYVVPHVIGELAQVEIGDAGHHGIEEVPVVRHHDHGVGVLGEIALEPVASIEVQVVGRLVEEQQVRAPEQQLGEGDAHLPAA
jgi:hypothetical protein